MTLLEAIRTAPYDWRTEIWAVPPFLPTSEARFGNSYLDTADRKDGKRFVATGETAGDTLALVEFQLEKDDLSGVVYEARMNEAAEQFIARREGTRLKTLLGGIK